MNFVVLSLVLALCFNPAFGERRERDLISEEIRLIKCDNDTANDWVNDYHNCLIEVKPRDGGRDLKNIVRRILNNSTDCVDKSNKWCRPQHEHFVAIVTKVIEQIHDYATMYLELISKGREDIKDLKCVENLNETRYRDCFKEALEKESNEVTLENDVEKAISCTNKRNRLCSNEAKTALNRMIRKIIGVKQQEEEFKKPIRSTTTTTLITHGHVRSQTETTTTQETPKEWRWYDYIIQPIISAWNYVKSWFG